MSAAGLSPIGYCIKSISRGVVMAVDSQAERPAVVVEVMVVLSVGESPAGWRRWVPRLMWAAAVGACVFGAYMGKRG